MLGRLGTYVRRNHLALIALFLALGGTSAYAANTVFSSDIVDGEVKTPDLAASAVTNGKLATNAVSNSKINDTAVNSAKVADNSLTGTDINEGSLVIPPSTGALKRIDFRSNAAATPATILNLGGLTITAKCGEDDPSFFPFEVNATTAVDNANINLILFPVGSPPEQTNDKDFNTLESFPIVHIASGPTVGVLVYSRPDGKHVTANFQMERTDGDDGPLGNTKKCLIGGTAAFADN